MIDLHMHTTASDGVCPPPEVVALCRQAGLRVMSVTDHDTVAAVAEVAALAAGEGMEAVPGIEITAVWQGLDVHVLGYFIDPDSARLRAFLEGQRAQRLDRLRVIARRLAELGMPIDIDAVIQPALDHPGRAAGRPWIARALVEAGYVTDTRDAFDRWLGTDRPAFVPRRGGAPAVVIQAIADAGGVASLAHPGLLGHDELIPELVDAGLGALEAYHSEHGTATTTRYLAMARDLGLAVSGGSDFHGGGAHGVDAPGAVTLPPEHFARLATRAGRPDLAARWVSGPASGR
ncbi:MAG TPA: PHP domain-containing protein [Vicinamibacterales bacterium]|nr:PHP domain-containing protein [Vicinamibacterales bacterium]